MTQDCISATAFFISATNVHSPPYHSHPQRKLIVVILIRGPSPHELRLTPPHINILVQHLPSRLREFHLLRLLNLLIDRRARLLINGLQLLLGRNIPLKQLLLQARDRVLRGAHALDLLARAVGGARVGHGVPAVAVGDVFEDDGPVAGDCVGFGVRDGCFDGEDVHAVYFEAGDVLPALVVVG
jgi:hypothetical protein